MRLWDGRFLWAGLKSLTTALIQILKTGGRPMRVAKDVEEDAEQKWNDECSAWMMRLFKQEREKDAKFQMIFFVLWVAGGRLSMHAGWGTRWPIRQAL